MSPAPARLAELDLDAARERLVHASTLRVSGRVHQVTGLVIGARIPGLRVGELCTIHNVDGGSVPAEVVGFRDRQVQLMALGEVSGIGPDSALHPTGRTLAVAVGPGLLGRVLNALGEPIDGRGPLTDIETRDYPVFTDPPAPLKRMPIRQPLSVGVRVIDSALTVGAGQRLGIFAGAGHGKSTLLAMMARNTSADVNVIALVGERGREVHDFLENALGPEGLKRSVVVVATSDEPPLLRIKAAYVATAIAESFRDLGKSVLFLMDSVTRFARAQREVGLATGEPPARGGFPPSVFAVLPRLLERTGNSDVGSITALYAVLVEGDDLSEPVADEVRSILDGHIVLSGELASRGHFPAIDLLKSASRLFEMLAEDRQRQLVYRLRDMLAAYERNRDLVLIGAYQAGSDPMVDAYLACQQQIREFLRQAVHEPGDLDQAVARLEAAVGGRGA
ncbi:MAG: FliI/YscN family ATPase [Thermoanaerobaculia bacterium]